jgi:DNA-binding NarL/FixJ family response regulator
MGYIIKDAPVDEIIAGIRRVHGGGRHLSAEIADKIAGQLYTVDLRDREVEVLRLMAEGKRNKEIAQALKLGLGTVKFHVSNILNKLGASDRTEAVVIALRRGLADI